MQQQGMPQLPVQVARHAALVAALLLLPPLHAVHGPPSGGSHLPLQAAACAALKGRLLLPLRPQQQQLLQQGQHCARRLMAAADAGCQCSWADSHKTQQQQTATAPLLTQARCKHHCLSLGCCCAATPALPAALGLPSTLAGCQGLPSQPACGLQRCCQGHRGLMQQAAPLPEHHRQPCRAGHCGQLQERGTPSPRLTWSGGFSDDPAESYWRLPARPGAEQLHLAEVCCHCNLPWHCKKPEAGCQTCCRPGSQQMQQATAAAPLLFATPQGRQALPAPT